MIRTHGCRDFNLTEMGNAGNPGRTVPLKKIPDPELSDFITLHAKPESA
jgi:hypothetical protein